jgi:hypothetical protein
MESLTDRDSRVGQCRSSMPLGVLVVSTVIAMSNVVAMRAGPAKASSAGSSKALNATILSLDDQLSDIYKRGDWSALRGLVAPDYLGSWGNFLTADLSRLQREFPKVRLKSFHRELAVVKSLSPGVVLLNENGRMEETYDGQDVSGRYRFTTVWVHRQGRWRLLFEQEVPLPQAP